MKTATSKILTRLLCIFLAFILLAVCILNVFAEGEIKHYVKEVKLIYADNLEEAKKSLPEGFRILEKNLNEGADSDNKVYFAYSTTTDPSEAATDIKMMNMNGGFVLSDYEEQIKDVKADVRKLAGDVKLAVSVFKENYTNGTYGAKAAYRALSAFTVDDAGGVNFADYLLYKDPTDEFYIRFVLNAHQDILSCVISALTMAVQGGAGDTWLDRLTAIENPGKIKEKPTYWDDSVTLYEHFYGFYEVYKTIDHSLYGANPEPPPKDAEDNADGSDSAPEPPPSDPDNQPDIDYNGTEALYEIAYKALQSYKFKTGETFSKWFLGDEVFAYGDELFEHYYAILEVMTPAELAMMRLCGPLYMILATSMDETAYNDYVKRVDEITGGETACSIWEGVNAELFHSSIGITDDAARKIAETEFERELNNQADSLGVTGLKMAGLITACGAVSLGVGMLTYYAFGSLMFTCFSGTALTTAASVVSICAQIFFSVSLALGVVAIVVALVIALVFLVIWIIELYKDSHPVYTDIPEFMYDYVEDGAGNNQFVLYEGVKFQDGRVADVNTWDGKEWHAMYVSHDAAAGAPIEADVIVRYGDGHIDKDFAGLSNFGHINAQNLNDYAFEDDVDGIFITYRQADLEGDYARKDYLSKVKLFSGENADEAITDLKNEGFTLYEANLTPDSDYVTYLGYQTTNYVDRALTDIRIAYCYNSKQYTTGGSKSSYAACGSTGDGMLTLYSTSISLFGSPIRSDFLILNDRNAPAGYEPVNLFSGGPAIGFNLEDETYIDPDKQFYFFFLPSVTYTSGEQYLGGLTVAYDVPHGTKMNGLGSINHTKNTHGYQILRTSWGEHLTEAAILYTTTYNPYRAIYNVTAVGSGGDMGNAFAQTIFYDGVGYSLVTRYMITAEERVRYEGVAQFTGDARLYVAGIYTGGTPLTLSDVYVSTSQKGAASADLTPVYARLSEDRSAVNLTGGIKVKWQDTGASIGGSKIHPIVEISPDPLYLFVRRNVSAEGKYLTHLYVTSKEEIIVGGGLDVDCDEIDVSCVMNQLGAMGARDAVLKNLNLKDSGNATFLGYTKKAHVQGSNTIIKPITNIVLYYAGKTDAPAKSTMFFEGISYELAGSVNLFCEEDGTDSKCKRVYLYYTTNPAAGSYVIDIKIDNNAILNGWETVRTQNKKALHSDMDEHSGSMWYIHMKRIEEEPKYVSEVVVGVGKSDASAKAALIAAGCDYILEKDLNDNVGIHSRYIYIGYNRTSDPKKAITDLRTTHNDEVDSFEKNGATYSKLEGNLNAFTNYFADDIYLYYTRDSAAGSPITALGTADSPANWSHGEGNRYVVSTVVKQDGKPSDLNDGAFGDYIYLLITRDKTDLGVIASIMGSGSIPAIIVCAAISVGTIAWVCVMQRRKRREKVGVTAAEGDAPTPSE